MIDLSNLTKQYGATRVVDAVSLQLPRGGLVSIIGPNGAGKSTLLSMVSRLLPMDAGRVEVDGLDVTTTAPDVLARRLSILRQDNHLAARLVVRDLVAFGRYPHTKGRMTAEDQRRVGEAIAYFDLEPIADRFLDEISGGQRQRAFIAMVFCQDTDYILLDEPLNNLDIKHAVGMMRLFRHIADSFGKTIVMVLHDINFASCYSDRIVVMGGGKVLRMGTPEEVITTEMIAQVYGLESQIHAVNGQRVAHYFR